MATNFYAAAFISLFFAIPLSAQVRRPIVQTRPHEEPCWQVAGVSKAAIQERQAIERETRSQVEAVCADTSLSAQQRQQKIREIRQQSKLKLEGLITPEQQASLQACQKERAANHPHTPGVKRPGTGPCGEAVPVRNPRPGNPGSGTGAPASTEEETPPQ